MVWKDRYLFRYQSGDNLNDGAYRVDAVGRLKFHLPVGVRFSGGSDSLPYLLLKMEWLTDASQAGRHF